MDRVRLNYDEGIDGTPLSSESEDDSPTNPKSSDSTDPGEPAHRVEAKPSNIKSFGFALAKNTSSKNVTSTTTMTSLPSSTAAPRSDEKKLGLSMAVTKSNKIAAIKMTISGQKSKETQPITLKRTNELISKVFNNDEESDEEEMPPEAKMRMRNIGKDTPTAAGPNSFSKGRLGFCNRQKILQRELEHELVKDTVKK